MLTNLIGIDGRQPAQKASSMVTKTESVISQGLVSPAFEAWLQAYRRRLEQACERPRLPAA